MHAVVLTFDRLPAHFLGCYGNEWIETPGFDALAAGAAVFERHVVEIPGPAGASHPWWTGQLEFFESSEGGSLFESLSRDGVRCQLVSEREEGLPAGGLVSDGYVTGEDGLDAAHDAVPFARLVTRGLELVEQFNSDQPELLWLHSEGVPTPWLPPEFFAGLYLDELEDRLDGTGAELAGDVISQLRADPVLAELLLSEPNDEDTDDGVGLDVLEEAFGETAVAISRFVFGGYVSLLDHWLQKLTAALAETQTDTLFIVTAAGGYSFGEQQALLQDAGLRGADLTDGALGDQTLQTPLLLWQPQTKSAGTRIRSLVQPPEIPVTLLDWFGSQQTEAMTGTSLLAGPGTSSANGRDVALHFGESGEVGIRDDNWLLAANREDLESTSDADAITARMYAKPEDFWEARNVADQSPGECQRLLTLLREKFVITRS